MINTFMHPCTFFKNHTRFQTKTAQKPHPLGRHMYMYMAYIREYLPLPRIFFIINSLIHRSIDSLRVDEIKFWLTPSAKQRQTPCCGLPAVYPDMSTRHHWPVKKGLCFGCRDRQSGWREIPNPLPVIRWVRWGSRTRISALLRRRY